MSCNCIVCNEELEYVPKRYDHHLKVGDIVNSTKEHDDIGLKPIKGATVVELDSFDPLVKLHIFHDKHPIVNVVWLEKVK